MVLIFRRMAISLAALLLCLACAACDRSNPYVTPDSGTTDGGSDDSGPPAPVQLLPVPQNDLLGMLAFDETYVYAALFSSLQGGGQSCTWTGRWVRVAKDGSSVTELGDAPVCVLYDSARAEIVGDSLYWLNYPGAGANSVATALMKLPKTGGTSTQVGLFPGRAFDNFGTDGRSFYVTEWGSATLGQADGFVARIDADGTMTMLAQQQYFPRWVGVTATDVVWSTPDDCGAGMLDCQSTTFYRAPTGGGARVAFGKASSGLVYPTTLSDDAVYFYDGSASVRRIGFDFSAAAFVSALWGMDHPYRIRIAGDEVVATKGGNPYYLLTAPRANAVSFLDNVAFEIDGKFLYIQSKGALVKMAVP
jgi:hypothetical protein